MSSLTARRIVLVAVVLCASVPANAQTLATLQGRVFDASGAVLPGATIRVENTSIGFEESVRTDSEGRYYVTAIPKWTVHGHGGGGRLSDGAHRNAERGRRPHPGA